MKGFGILSLAEKNHFPSEIRTQSQFNLCVNSIQSSTEIPIVIFTRLSLITEIVNYESQLSQIHCEMALRNVLTALVSIVLTVWPHAHRT
jgi:hypothetical protein